MIDRRRFVQSMMVLGAAAGVRPATVLFGSPAAGELRDLADAAALGREDGRRLVRRHPDQPLSQPVHLHARSRASRTS